MHCTDRRAEAAKRGNEAERRERTVALSAVLKPRCRALPISAMGLARGQVGAGWFPKSKVSDINSTSLTIHALTRIRGARPRFSLPANIAIRCPLVSSSAGAFPFPSLSRRKISQFRRSARRVHRSFESRIHLFTNRTEAIVERGDHPHLTITRETKRIYSLLSKNLQRKRPVSSAPGE